jgi:hypothetical protein
MLIKTADDKQPVIAGLEAQLERPHFDAGMRARIDHEIRLVSAGWRAERDAGHQIESHFGSSRNYATLHDLRIELDGQVAQVDHLVISRLLQMWVCDSKSYHSGVWLNDHGEWSTRVNGRRVVLPSPIEQNHTRIALLGRLFETGACPPPRRLGARITPELRGLVVISDDSRITRSEGRVEGLEAVIRAEKLRKTIRAQFDDRLRGMLRVVSRSELERFAGALAALHRPPPLDFETRFGLEPTPVPLATRATLAQGRSHPPCQHCRRALTKEEAWFCRLNKRFSGGFYCADCQHGGAPVAWVQERDARSSATAR